MIYTYSAAYLCEDCAENVIRDRLKAYHEVQAGILPDDPLQRQWKENDASQVPEAECRRCGYLWVPQPDDYDPMWMQCPRCLDRSGAFDDCTFDSDDFPKSVCGEIYSDCPEFCDHCQAFLENGLTSDGVCYTLENFSDHEEVRRYYYWLDWPSEEGEDDEVLQD